MSSKYWDIKAAANDSTDVFIYDRIGADFWSGEGVTAKKFVQDLKKIDTKQINMRINSPGGSVFEAQAIYTALKEHPSNVTAYIDGLAASAATFISMAADEVVMADNALFMIHNPATMAAGDATEMRKTAEILDKITSTMVDIYMQRYSGTEADLRAALDAETWYSAAEALDAGFADSTDAAIPAAASFDYDLFKAFGYKNAPKADLAAAPEVSEPSTDDAENPTTTEGDEVDTTVTPAEAVETVEAAVPTNVAKPVNFIASRNPVVSPETFLMHKVRAMQGDDQSRQYIAAATTSSDNPGLIPTRQLTEVVNGLANPVRASIDSISSGTLPSAGLVFQIPKITQLPAVGVVNEGVTVVETPMESEFIDVYVKSFKGVGSMTVELADRSDPLYYSELISNMGAQYAEATNAYNSGQILTGSTSPATTFAAPISATDILKWVANGAVSVYENTHKFADAIVVSPAQWGNIMSMSVDGRPIYNAIAPMNAAGNAQPRALRGSVNGLDLWVDTALTGTGDGSMYVINRDAYTWYESPKLELRTNFTEDGSISILLYGYGATATKIAAGAYNYQAS